MFFEGLPASHLASTIILRGASKIELRKLKSVALNFIFARYSWRLEQSFLMDTFAKPPNPKCDFFSTKENSPDNHYDTENNRIVVPTYEDSIFCKTDETNKVEISLSRTEVSEDPLQSEHFNSSEQILSVTEMPLLNRFRKALDDTILSYSPYLMFTVPFLETDLGSKCKLRKFFPKDIYYSAQFLEGGDKTALKQITTCDKKDFVNENIYKVKYMNHSSNLNPRV